MNQKLRIMRLNGGYQIDECHSKMNTTYHAENSAPLPPLDVY